MSNFKITEPWNHPTDQPKEKFREMRGTSRTIIHFSPSGNVGKTVTERLQT